MKTLRAIMVVTLTLLFSLAVFHYGGGALSRANATDNAVAATGNGAAAALELKVMSLQNADAGTLTKTIQPLFASAATTPTVIVFDKRTNAIIARGSESELRVLEALLLRLDEAPADRTTN